MALNVPTKLNVCLHVRCIDNSPSAVAQGKPFRDPLEKGKVYIAYSIAKVLNTTLNGSDMSFFIMEPETGRKLQPYDGIPTWNASRFELIMYTLN